MTNPFDFDEQYPDMDISLSSPEEAYEMGVSAGVDYGRREALKAVNARLKWEEINGRFTSI